MSQQWSTEGHDTGPGTPVGTGGVDDPALDLLTAPQARVLGSLLEKEMVTPDSYPLTLRALISACNQTTSRSPVVDYPETLVDTTLHALKAKGLVRFVHPSHGERVTKYRQVVSESLGLDPAERALVTLLLLRGAQTASELRSRSERLHPFADVAQVETVLDALASREAPLVSRIARQPGQKGERWIQLLEVDPAGRADSGTEQPTTRPEPAPTVGPLDGSATGDVTGRIEALEERVARLESRLEMLAEALGEDLGTEAPTTAGP